MTRLALNLSEYVNGVAERHAEISRGMFPGYQVHAVTNGVHPLTWTAESFRTLYDRYLPQLVPRARATGASRLLHPRQRDSGRRIGRPSRC